MSAEVEWLSRKRGGAAALKRRSVSCLDGLETTWGRFDLGNSEGGLC